MACGVLESVSIGKNENEASQCQTKCVLFALQVSLKKEQKINPDTSIPFHTFQNFLKKAFRETCSFYISALLKALLWNGHY